MTRKLIAVVLALAAVAGGVWFFWLRHRDEHAEVATTPASRSGDLSGAAGAHGKGDRDPSARGLAPRWSLDVDPDGPLRLEGQVVGVDGKPVGGAEIWLSSVPSRSAKSAEDGSFSFDKLVGRSYSLTAITGDQLGGPVTYKLTAKSDPVVIHIAPGAGVVVTVRDDKHEPVADAEVKVAELGDRAAKTDATGVAKLVPIHAGWALVSVTAAGYAPGSAYTAVGAAGSLGQVTITLRTGVPVSGRVLDEAGKPIAKASVADSTGDPWDFATDANRVTTDAKGEFTFPALAAGRHTLTVTDGEHAPAVSPPIAIAADKVTGIEIRMAAGGVLAGTVVDSDSHAVAFATVRVAGTGRKMWQGVSRQTTTDEHGAFELRGLARIKVQARAESDEAASALVDADLGTKTAVRDLRLVLDVKGTIAGVVVDETGKPVPEVGVNAFPDILGGASTDGLAIAGMSSATTDGDGAFTIHGLPDGAYRLWAARHTEGNEGWGQKNVGAHAGDRSVRIVMPAAGGLIGKLVVDGQSTPPALASIAVGQRTPSPISAGTFALTDLEPGKYDVTFRGAEFAELIERDIEVLPGKTTDLGTVTAAHGRKLTGTVVDSTGTPVGNARVRVGEMLISSAGGDDSSSGFDGVSGIRSGVSATDGSFVIIGIPTKATNVIADESTHGQSLGMPVAAGTDDPPAVTLTLRGFGSIIGTVTQQGAPVPDIMVSESSQGGGAAASLSSTAADGSFVMAQVPEGTVVLTAMRQQAMAMTSASATVDVVAGKQSTVTIDIPVGDVTLNVAIVAAAGATVNAAQVFLFHGTVNPTTGKQLTDGMFQGGVGGMKFWFNTGPGGSPASFAQLVPGDYSVCSIPITGDMHDPTLMGRIQENVATLAVYCQQVKLASAPIAQSVTQTLPAMSPLPTPPSN